MVAAELARLQERERFLESELKAAQTNGMSTPGRLDEHTLIALVGEETARVLASAREASSQIRDRAEESATRMVKEASEDAIRIRQAAEHEAQRLREDASGDAHGEIELAKQQGREMVEEARAYREKVLAELSRRRDAARQQIEQLMHGRDRLLAAFERARGASEEVIKDLVDVEEDSELLIGLPSTAATPKPVAIPDNVPPRVETIDSSHSSAVSAEHPSVTIFDHEREDGAVSITRRPQPPSTISSPTESPTDSTTSIFDVVAEEIAEEFAEEEIECETDSADGLAHEVGNDVAAQTEVDDHVGVDPDINEPMTGDVSDTTSDVADATDTDDGFVAPIVSIFGGRRRPLIPAPEHPAPENEELTDEPAPDSHFEEITVGDAPERVSPGKQAIDDIFARLRASSPAAVVEEVNGEPDVDVTPTKRPKKEHMPAARPIPVTPIVEPERFVSRDEALAPLCESISKRMKRVLADELNEILEHLNSKKPKLEVEAMVSTADLHVARYVASLADDILASATVGAKSMKSARGSVKRVDPKKVEESVRAIVSDTIVVPLRARLEQVLRDCDGNTDDIADGVRAIYREWKMSRIDAHSGDVACVAHSRGAFLSLEEGTSVCWMVDPNGPACADAEDNSLAGAVTCGEKFPTGHEHPLAHPGCRCLVCPMPH